MYFFRLLLMSVKYWYFRSHYWKSTIFEIIVPIMTVALLCYIAGHFTTYKMKSEIDKLREHELRFARHSQQLRTSDDRRYQSSGITKHISDNLTVNRKKRLLSEDREVVYVFFTPNNTMTRKFSRQIETYANDNFKFITRPANTTDDLMKRMDHNPTHSADNFLQLIGVNFHKSLQEDKISDKFVYTLYTKNQDLNKLYYPLSKEFKELKRKRTEYIDKGYFDLQLAININVLDEKVESETGLAIFDYIYDFFFKSVGHLPHPKERKFVDKEKIIIIKSLNYLILMILIFQAGPLIAAIIAERETGVKELLKIYGITESLVWINWFLNTLIFSLALGSIIAAMVQIGWAGKKTSVLQYTNPIIFWLLFNLTMIANTLVAFTVAATFQKTIYAVISFIIITMTPSMVCEFSENEIISIVTMLTPSGALGQGFKRIERYEASTEYLTFANLSETEHLTREYSMLVVLGMLVAQMICYIFLIFYISKINPGPFGVKRSPLFIFGLGSIKRKQRSKTVAETVTSNDKNKNPYIEKAPTSLQPDIVIENVYKRYGSIQAIEKANLIIYKNEITALLGPNGAGKTTLIAILTGFTNVTSGSIIYDGKIDVLKKNDAFRANIGFCPQENRLFPYMSAKQHLVFFARLRGATAEEATKQTAKYIQYAELDGNEMKPVDKLSAGMKRKLCLGIALVGKSKVIILDEPTAGVDVQSRRKLWNLLLRLRNNRTIILTTHYLEEADAIGDRIAIMIHGTVKTHGTSMFLKYTFETGYRITITKTNDSTTSQKLISLIRSVLPNAKIEHSKTPTEVVVVLPLADSRKYQRVFEVLEQNSNNLKIIRIGVGYTSLEDVFLKVSSKFEEDLTKREMSIASIIYPELNKLQGFPLMWQQLIFLIYKKLMYTIKNGYTIFFRIFVPTLLLCVVFYVVRGVVNKNRKIILNMKTYPGGVYVTTEEFSKGDLGQPFAEYVRETKGRPMIFKNADERGKYMEKHYLKYKYDTIMDSAEIDGDFSFGYNPLLTYSPAIIINTVSNAVLKLDNQSSSIATKLRIVKEYTSINGTAGQVKLDLVIWSIAVGFFTIDLSTYFSILVIYERQEGFKHVQELTKVSAFLYWFSHIIVDMIIFLIIVSVRWFLFHMISMTEFLQFHSNFSDTNDVFVIFVLSTFIFIYAVLMFTYTTSFLSKSPSTYYIMCTSTNVIGLFPVIAVLLIDYLIGMESEDSESYNQSKSRHAIGFVLTPIKWIYHFHPPLTYMALIIKLCVTWFHNYVEKKNYPYFGGKPSNKSPLSLSGEFWWLCICSVIYTLILYLIEYGFTVRIITTYLEKKKYGTLSKLEPTTPSDHNVITERKIVNENFKKQDPNSRFIVMVNSLKKVYYSILNPYLAVKNVSFTVKASQCFGLLGLNGAGKSTIFRMLAAEIKPTDGDASISNHKMSKDYHKYLADIGYCAQTNALIEQLTGRQMLTLCAALEGIPRKGRKQLIDDWLTVLDLEEYEDRPCGTYSGGSKRKLCVAICLIGNPKVIFLDEPTAGVDAVSKRKLYSIMQLSRAKGQAIVLTSHSMEECELLCDRLTIMAYGEMKCIGSPQELKLQFAQGFAVQIKIAPLSQEETSKFQLVMKDEMKTMFGKQLQITDEHEGLIEFEITDTSLPWSQLFGRMEHLKEKYSFIENYVISDTTLEQVFLSFSHK